VKRLELLTRCSEGAAPQTTCGNGENHRRPPG
jgi:hypothetical protein